MPRRQSSFARALSDAEKRLEKALAERKEALERISELAKEIPHLETIIGSLSGKGVMPIESATARHKAVALTGDSPSGERVSAIPADLAAIVGPQDLTGMGSIPALTEDQTLPDDFEVLPKK